MLLIIDNYDSFTYNLVQYFEALGITVEVYRNDELTVEAIEAKEPNQIVISPPGIDSHRLRKKLLANFLRL